MDVCIVAVERSYRCELEAHVSEAGAKVTPLAREDIRMITSSGLMKGLDALSFYALTSEDESIDRGRFMGRLCGQTEILHLENFTGKTPEEVKDIIKQRIDSAYKATRLARLGRVVFPSWHMTDEAEKEWDERVGQFVEKYIWN